MSAEVLYRETRPEIEVFTENLARISKERFAEELASYRMETKRIPDPYYYTLDKDGDLYHPEGKTKVRNFIRRETEVEKLEFQAFENISTWFRQRDCGSIVWVSPPAPGVYFISKIIISDIKTENGQKRLHNRAILLDYNEEKCLKLAQDLTRFNENQPLLTHLDQVRSTPIVLNTHGMDWLYILQELIDEPVLWRMVQDGLDKKAKREAVEYADEVYQRLFGGPRGLLEGQKMMAGMLGEKQGSCPVTSRKSTLETFFGSSTFLGTNFLESDQYGSLEFECPKCGVANRRIQGQLLSNCGYCGAGVGC